MAEMLVKNKSTKLSQLVKDAGVKPTGWYYFGLSWDERKGDGAPYDLDVHAFLLDKARKVVGTTNAEKARNWGFWGNQTAGNGAVVVSPDEKVGAKEGDDEWIKVFTGDLSPEVNEVLIAVNMYLDPAEAQKLKDAGRSLPTFGEVDNAMFRVHALEAKENGSDDKPQIGAKLAEPYYMGVDADDVSCAIFVTVIRHPANPDEWMVKPIESGFEKGVDALAVAHGIDLNGAIEALGLAGA